MQTVRPPAASNYFRWAPLTRPQRSCCPLSIAKGFSKHHNPPETPSKLLLTENKTRVMLTNSLFRAVRVIDHRQPNSVTVQPTNEKTIPTRAVQRRQQGLAAKVPLPTLNFPSGSRNSYKASRARAVASPAIAPYRTSRRAQKSPSKEILQNARRFVLSRFVNKLPGKTGGCVNKPFRSPGRIQRRKCVPAPKSTPAQRASVATPPTLPNSPFDFHDFSGHSPRIPAALEATNLNNGH